MRQIQEYDVTTDIQPIEGTYPVLVARRPRLNMQESVRQKCIHFVLSLWIMGLPSASVLARHASYGSAR